MTSKTDFMKIQQKGIVVTCRSCGWGLQCGPKDKPDLEQMVSHVSATGHELMVLTEQRCTLVSGDEAQATIEGLQS